MITRALCASGLVVVAFGCSRTSEGPKPRAFPEPGADGSVDGSSVDASIKRSQEEPEGPPSIFTLVARAPTGRLGSIESDIANALPLVQRLPGEGLLIASEYGRAYASGPGALVVEVTSDAEAEVFYRRGDVQGAQLLRWVWSDGKASVVSAEEATMRTGPRVSTSATGPKGFWRTQPSAGYWSAVVRDGSVLALERIGYSIPNPMYARPAPNDTAGALKPASVAVLSGKAAPLAFPPRVCAKTMAAAPDGTVVVVVDKCEGGGASASRTIVPDAIGVLRYPPHATVAKLEWLPTRTAKPDDPDDMLVAAASANEIHVGHGAQLESWNGKAWSTSTPFDADRIISLSAGVDGSLWAIARRGGEGGYVTVKKPVATKWEDVPLPKLPTTPLDDVPYQAPTLNEMTFRKGADAISGARGGPFTPRKIDAAGEEILVLGIADREAFVLSTKPRGAVARIPSIDAQRAQLAKSLPRKKTALEKAGKLCFDSFLAFPEGTKPEALGLGPLPDGGPQLRAAEGIVEGKPQLIVYAMTRSTNDDIDVAAKRFASMSPTRVCGPPVIERDF